MALPVQPPSPPKLALVPCTCAPCAAILRTGAAIGILELAPPNMDDESMRRHLSCYRRLCLCRDGSCEADRKEVHWGREGSSQEEGDRVLSNGREILFLITMLLGVIRGPAKGFSNCTSTHGAPPGEEEEEVQGGNCGPEGDSALPEVNRAADQEVAFPAAP